MMNTFLQDLRFGARMLPTQPGFTLIAILTLALLAGDVLRLIAGQGPKLVVVPDVAIGVAAAFALMRLMKSLLFGVSAADPLTFVVIVAVLLLVSWLACWIPARRATKVDPMIALRCE